MIIGDIARMNAARYGHNTAFKDERRALSYDLANRRMNAFIRALYGLGLKKGDRIAVLLYNRAEYGELLYGLPKGGFAMVPLNYRLIGRELKYMLNDSEANTILYQQDFADTLNEIRPDLETVQNYILVDPTDDSKSDDYLYEEMIENESDKEISFGVDDSDVAFILYTSGTTGLPKGAMLTHKNIFTNICNAIFDKPVKTGDKLFDVPPLYHCAAQTEMFVYSFYGNQIVTLQQFDPKAVLETLKAERPNVVHMVPAMLNMVINHPDVGDYDFSFLELILYGGSTIMRAHLKKSIEIFGCNFFQTAGMTESSPCLTCLLPEEHVVEGPDYLVRRLGSAGRAVKLTEVKIVDPDGNECPPDTSGEMIVRGNNIMKGYWKKPKETAETVIEGWLHTGDICLKDEGSYVYYVDRIKDMINRGGENVYPREIEEVISSHPRVLEAAVIAVPDERLQEEIMALVVLNEGPPINEREIVSICEDQLARFKKPRYVTFMDHLPKTASGKTLKRELREKYEKEPLPPRVKKQ